MEQWTVRFAPHLRALVELDSAGGHMRQAASELGIPQSSMSRRIKTLEDELGVPLLIHEGRIVRLSDPAVELVRRVRGPLRQVDEALAGAVAGVDAAHGTVRFGFPLTLGAARTADLLAGFRASQPKVRLHLKQAHAALLRGDLADGSLDVALVIPPPPGFGGDVVASQQIVAVVGAGHPLAGRSSLALSELASEPFVLNPTSYQLRSVTEEWCREAGFAPDVAMEVTEFSTMRELVARGLGVALLPAHESAVAGVVEVPLSGGPYQRDIALVRSETSHTPVVEAFAEYLRGEFA